MKILFRVKRFDLSNCSADSKYYGDSNKLVASKIYISGDTSGVTIKEFER